MEYFHLAWAETLLPGCLGGGWRLALAYLAWCPTHGAAAAEALMEALPVGGGSYDLLWHMWYEAAHGGAAGGW